MSYATKSNGPRESTSSIGSGTKLSTSSVSSTLEEETTRTYRTSIAPRNIIIQRNSYSGLSSAPTRVGYTRERSIQYGANMAAVPPGAYEAVTTSGVNSVKESREKEKRDMQDLNERFASYIEKVRFLEAQNRRLADELEKLKSTWGKETSTIKMMYQAELDEARKLLDDATREKSRLEIRVTSLEEQLEEALQKLDESKREVGALKEKIERQNQQLSDLEAEVNLLRRRVESADQDREKDKRTIAQLQDALNKARIDLDNETLLHIDAENRRQTLEEELEFLKSLHEQELKELAALAYRDTTSENREFWKNEMGQALREIQHVYDEKLDVLRHELESHYNLKIQEFRTGAAKQSMETVHSKEETKRLKTQIGDLRDKLNDLENKNAQLQRELNNLRREKEDRERELEQENHDLKSEVAKLRAELEAILHELQNIMDTKLGLELEIAAYRKLLEGEENRLGFKSAVDAWAGLMNNEDEIKKAPAAPHQDAAPPRRSPVKGEMSAKTTYQKSAKGPVTIPECSADGKYVQLENTGRKDENLGDWCIRRTVDGVEKPKYMFGLDVVLKPGARVKVWAKGTKPSQAPETDLECGEPSWGVGADIVTRLVNPVGEDKASHIQRTTYTQ